MMANHREVTGEILKQVYALDADLKAWPFMWVGRTYMSARYGQRCKKIATLVKRTTALVQFEDGMQVRAPYTFFRRRPTR
jgi:hypothetical protein